MENTPNSIDHNKLSILDRIAIIGELEHIRRHAIRSANSSSEEEEKLFYGVIGQKAKRLRRKYQKEYLDCKDRDWCLVKSAATLKQLFYEVDCEFDCLNEAESLADEILSHAYNTDLSGCESCANDKEDIQ